MNLFLIYWNYNGDNSLKKIYTTKKEAQAYADSRNSPTQIGKFIVCATTTDDKETI